MKPQSSWSVINGVVLQLVGTPSRPNETALARERRLAKTRAWRKNAYQARKLAGLCVDCSAGLQDGDAQRCVECEERDRAQKARPGARVRDAARDRKYREQRRAAGQCSNCPAPALPNQTRCENHREKNMIADRRYVEKKRASK